MYKIKIQWEKAVLFSLFLFSISLFNLTGYIFSAIIAVMFMMNLKSIRISIAEILLLFYSFFYFCFYFYHYGCGIEEIILYLIGPWSAYILGKLFVEKSNKESAFLYFIFVLSIGMFLHGFLNWVAYMRSSHYETYMFYRRSVDFWRQDLVNVTVTGMYYTFITGISIGILFSKNTRKTKIFSAAVLLTCIFLSAFFANRTLLFIVGIIFLWRFAIWFSLRSVKLKRKIMVLIAICFGLFLTIGLLDIYEPLGELQSLKIIQRMTDVREGIRLNVWAYFIKDMNFLIYPFGGGHIIKDSPYGYLHNMWLDVYNTVGCIPFVLLVLFTIYVFKKLLEFRKVMIQHSLNNENIIVSCLIAAIVLNCAVEPIIEANPYYFLIVLMFIGAMEAKMKKIKKVLE